MNTQIHQMNMSYSAGQDRLLCRVSTTQAEEFRIWFTRRFVKLLLTLLVKEIDKRGGMPHVAANQETTKMLQQGALEQKYEIKKEATYPFGEHGMLASRMNAATKDDNLHLELLPEKGQGLTFTLNQSLLFMFYNILSQAISHADWGISNEQMVSMKLH